MSSQTPEDVLSFWFSDRDDDGNPVFRKAWFEKDPAFDETMRQRFGAVHEQAAARMLEAWREEPQPALALTVLLDQFSRNMFRDTPVMYACDDYAVEVAGGALARGFGDGMPEVQRWFFFMPFMHSERLADQQTCVRLFESLPDSEAVQQGLKSARRHCEIVERFGRFPHRNAILGRQTTADEEVFLKEPDSAF